MRVDTEVCDLEIWNGIPDVEVEYVPVSSKKRWKVEEIVSVMIGIRHDIEILPAMNDYMLEDLAEEVEREMME